MPMGKGTYGSKVGRPPKKKTGMMHGGMTAKKKPMGMMYGGMAKKKKPMMNKGGASKKK